MKLNISVLHITKITTDSNNMVEIYALERILDSGDDSLWVKVWKEGIWKTSRHNECEYIRCFIFMMALFLYWYISIANSYAYVCYIMDE